MLALERLAPSGLLPVLPSSSLGLCSEFSSCDPCGLGLGGPAWMDAVLAISPSSAAARLEPLGVLLHRPGCKALPRRRLRRLAAALLPLCGRGWLSERISSSPPESLTSIVIASSLHLRLAERLRASGRSGSCSSASGAGLCQEWFPLRCPPAQRCRVPSGRGTVSDWCLRPWLPLSTSPP